MFYFWSIYYRKKEKSVDYADFVTYCARLEDLGEQVLDLVAEIRADPPQGWPRPCLGAVPVVGVAVDVPKKAVAING